MTATAILKTPQEQPSGSAKGSSFYAAMRIMPPEQRAAMYEIYRYCRALDDIADEAGEREDKLARLNAWRADVAQLYAGTISPALKELASAVTDFSLRREDLLAVIDGMEMDVQGPIQAPDRATLTLYCDRVACAVGRLCVRVFGLPEAQGFDLSHHLGMALQLTNILRDLDEDAALERLYLPQELLHEAGIETKDPAQALAHPAIDAACRKIAEEAISHFAQADRIMVDCARRQSRTPHVMSQAYRSILTSLTARGFTAPRRCVRLSKMRLGYILVRNLLF